MPVVACSCPRADEPISVSMSGEPLLSAGSPGGDGGGDGGGAAVKAAAEELRGAFFERTTRCCARRALLSRRASAALAALGLEHASTPSSLSSSACSHVSVQHNSPHPAAVQMRPACVQPGVAARERCCSFRKSGAIVDSSARRAEQPRPTRRVPDARRCDAFLAAFGLLQ